MLICSSLFFFTHTPTTLIYTLSLHDALPIFSRLLLLGVGDQRVLHFLERHQHGRAVREQRLFLRLVLHADVGANPPGVEEDRKSTRLNSSHGYISYAVFCLKKKKKQK